MKIRSEPPSFRRSRPKTEDNAIAGPLAVTGTAEELDRKLSGELVDFVGANMQLQTTLATAKAEMDAAAKAAQEEARMKTAKPAKTPAATSEPKPAPEPPAPDPPLFAQQPEAVPTGAH